MLNEGEALIVVLTFIVVLSSYRLRSIGDWIGRLMGGGKAEPSDPASN